MDCSPPGSSVHGILEAMILEWVAISFSKGAFPTQGLNSGLLHCRRILYWLGHQGSPVFTFNDIAFSFICCSVAPPCLTLCHPMDCSMPSFSVFHHLLELAQTYVHWVSDVIQPSHPRRPLLLLPSIFPSIRVFSNKSALCAWWPKYWSLNFSISPSNEYSGLISFRIDLFDFLAVQGILKSLLQHLSSKASILQHSAVV